MEIYQDYLELFELLNANNVEYMIVGGYALAFYGHPRTTGDIDIWVKPDNANAEKILKALDDFGFGGLGLNVDDFNTPDKIVQLGYPPVRIDLLTSLSGITWEEAINHIVYSEYANVPVKIIGLEAFKKNKKVTGRLKDLADLESLDE